MLARLRSKDGRFSVTRIEDSGLVRAMRVNCIPNLSGPESRHVLTAKLWLRGMAQSLRRPVADLNDQPPSRHRV
jgi:hypothetical protein